MNSAIEHAPKVSKTQKRVINFIKAIVLTTAGYVWGTTGNIWWFVGIVGGYMVFILFIALLCLAWIGAIARGAMEK